MSKCRNGVTLLELIVVLTLLGVVAGVVVLAARRVPSPTAISPALARLQQIRDSSLRTGHRVTIREGALFATALPDGRVVADTGLGIDPLTGRQRARR